MKIKAVLGFFAICAALWVAHPSRLMADAQTEPSYGNQVQMQRVFATPIQWVGIQEPSEAESLALLNAIRTFGTNDVNVGIAALEDFITVHPNSAWTPSLLVNLAEFHSNEGRFTLALAQYEAAWTATKNWNDPAGRKLAARDAAGLASLLTDLGQKEKLETLLNEVGQSKISLGIYSTPVFAAKRQLRTMQSRRGDAYKCGLVALNNLAEVLHIDSPIKRYLSHTASPDGGFTLAQLLVMAKTNGIPLEAVHRPAGADLVVPCIMHWKFNHYSVVTAAQGGRYQVANPVSGSCVYMTTSAIDAESSGAFLVPAGKAPTTWQILTALECDGIHGGCYGGPPDDADDDSPDCDSGDEGSCSDPCDPPSANDGASGDGGSPCPSAVDAGMAQWRVSEPYIELWLQDTPLRYRLSSGQWMSLKLSYKQHDAAEDVNVGGFGPNWECNWIGILEQPSPGSYANHLAGGGVRPFSIGVADYKSGRILSTVSGPSGVVPIITSPTGSMNRYAYAFSSLTKGQYNFLSRRVDRYGRYILYNYITYDNNNVKLMSIVDKESRTITLAYNNSAYPNLITSVTDPYNRTCYFTYDNQGRLTNIVDTIGMSSSFKYDGNNLITNLTTPYGQTYFQSVEGTSSIFSENRSLLVTEANAEHQLYAYCSQRDEGTNSDYSIGDGENNFRNSYHWNRAQYAAAGIQSYVGTPPDPTKLLDLPATSYLMAEIKHWLHNSTSDGSAPVCDTLGAMAGPVDPLLSSPGNNVRSGAVSYQYYGQSQQSSCIGTMKRVTAIANANFSVIYLAIQRNSIGRPTMFTHYNSDGSSATYTNVYDSSGMYLQSEWGPRGELVRGYGYNNPFYTNLLTSVTNAVGDVISYTHDTNLPTVNPMIRGEMIPYNGRSLKVTSITFPGGLVRTNVYYAQGSASQGFLQMQADIGIRTNYYTYLNGNVAIQTNELGLVTSNTWDNLNRLVNTAHPDGTTIYNLYDKLDVIGTKDRLNQWTYYGYNPVRQLMAETNVNGQVTQYDYCGCGSPDLITHWLGSRAINTYLNYDIAGRLTSALYPDSYQISRTYDVNNQLQTVSDTAGRTLQLSYAQHGLKFDLATAGMLSQGLPYQLLAQTFDEYGRVTNSVDRNAVTVTNGYDLLGRLVARRSLGDSGALESGLETFVYNALGLTNYFDPLQHRTTYVRDVAGRVSYETNANLEVLKFTYNPSDELLTLTDGKNQTTRWNYDTYGRVTNKVDNTSAEMFRYAYDPNDRLTNRLQAGSVVTTYGYDPIGNLTLVTYPGSGMVNQYHYDDLNRLTTMMDALGTTTFSWTDGDQLAGETGPWVNDAVSYTYLNRLRATLGLLQPGGTAAWSQSYQYDEFMRLTNVTSPAGVFGYQYATLTAPGGAATLPDLVHQLSFPNKSTSLRGYDDLGRLTLAKLTDATGNAIYDQHGYQYDLGSQRTNQTFAAGNYQNYTYDNIGQLKTARGYEAGGSTARAQEQFGYNYDAAWNLNQRTSGALVQTFAVNSVNELSTASRPANATITVAGAYENGTTPVSVTVSGTGLASGAATVYADKTWVKTGASPVDGPNTYNVTATDSAGKTSQDSVSVYLPVNVTYQYDGRGNLTSDGRRSFAYDDENQLTNVYVASAWRNDYAYDGLMRRRILREYKWNTATSGWVQTNEVHYVYDGCLPIQERDGNNVPRVTYTRGNDLSGDLQDAGGIGGLLARTDMTFNSPLASAYYQADGNGNVTCMIDYNNAVQARYSYDPYGNMLAMSGPLADANTYRFSSKEWNANAGLYYYLYRCYDPNVQRWVNRDPIQDDGGINLYQFVGNNTINYIDPLGLKWCVGTARVLKGNSKLIGKHGGFQVPITDNSAAVDPAQWGGKGKLRPILGDISGIYWDKKSSSYKEFSGITDVIGGDAPKGYPVGSNVRDDLKDEYPGQLLIELPSADKDPGIVPIAVSVPDSCPCPEGTHKQ